MAEHKVTVTRRDKPRRAWQASCVCSWATPWGTQPSVVASLGRRHGHASGWGSVGWAVPKRRDEPP